MIYNINIKNFKSHKNTDLKLSNLNVFCGNNGVGKSSAMQLLLLLREAFIKDRSFDVLDLKSNPVKIGTVNDAVYEFSDIDGFSLDMNSDIGDYKFFFEADSEDDKVKSFIRLKKECSDFPKSIEMESLFNTNFHFISAYRLGPQIQYPKDDKIIDVYKQISVIDGNSEYFVHYLDRYRNIEVLSGICNSKTSFTDLFSQVIAWEKEISQGVNIDIQDLGKLGYVLKYSFDTETSTRKTRNFEATNVGFGLSYVMPILVAILSSTKGSLLFIENPEAHLHPNGIAKLTELICLASQEGIQIILETHSDHIINGVLVQSKIFNETDGTKGINSDNVSLYQFERNHKDHFTNAINIEIESDGVIRYTPNGFFDQFTIDRKFLMGF
jgi:predicted ATPase